MKLLVIILSCTLPCAFAQDVTSNPISLTISGDSLICSGVCRTLEVSLISSNNSDHDVHVYGLKNGGPYPVSFSLSELCDTENVGTGIGFAIYSGSTQMKPILTTGGNRKNRRVTKEKLDSALLKTKVDFLKSGMVLKKHESITLEKMVPLEDFNFGPGIYYLQIAYYCGKESLNILNLENRNSPLTNLFQGCATSFKIPIYN
ncbi:hypothetical protein ACFQ21_05285 [Ohtaekwangia kribbensis]|uniref:Uncharacterized protein n=1 Tax=Ohtaekwangia kribbensis TaxID=688913 RepID=A0ABW3JXY0_9BACT